jgi:hypothetical protein
MQEAGPSVFQPPQTRVSEPVHWERQAVRVGCGKKGRVVNTLMEECAKQCTDETWQPIFARAARGKLPRGFALRETRLSVKIKKKISAITLPAQPEAAAEAFRAFVDLYDNIYTDAKNVAPSLETSERAFGRNLAHRKKYRRRVVDAFLRDQAKEHNLTPAQAREAAFTLHTGFVLGYFRCKDIAAARGEPRVLGVRGFLFNPVLRRFVIHPNNLSRNPAKKKPTAKKLTSNKDMNAVNFAEMTISRAAAEPVIHPPSIHEDNINISYILSELEM